MIVLTCCVFSHGKTVPDSLQQTTEKHPRLIGFKKGLVAPQCFINLPRSCRIIGLG